MRLSFFSLLLLPLVASSPNQHPLAVSSATLSPPISTQSTTLVDLLSSSNRTLLIRAFQRARLIPLLNKLNGSTLLAPSEEAIIKARDKERASFTSHGGSGIWDYALSTSIDDDSLAEQHDNLQLELRDTLLYHILNYTLVSPPPSTNTSSPGSVLIGTLPTLHETLYHPSVSPYNKSFPYPPSLPGSPPDDPDPDKPDKPIEGLLRGQGQVLRILFGQEKELKDGSKTPALPVRVGTDWQGEGGSPVVEGSQVWVRNGMLLVLDEVLERPNDLATQIRNDPTLSTFATLLPPSLLDYISTAPHLTIFAPTNDAWGQLSDLEMRYLQSGFAESDLALIFGDSASSAGAGNGKVGYLEVLLGKARNESTTVETYYESPLVVSPEAEAGRAKVNETVVAIPDILASNGVLHTVPSLLLPSGSLSLTAEKYLLALNATKFVSLLRSVNLSHYVQIPSDIPSLSPPPASSLLSSLAEFDGATEKYTILAPQDNVFDAWLKEDVGSEETYRTAVSASTVPEPGSKALKELLQYHIVSGRWTSRELEDNMLVGTELRGDSLKGRRQKLAVSVQNAEIGLGVDAEKKKRTQEGVVGFGGASVVGEPVQVGSSIIYLLASVLEPPTTLVTTAVSDLRLSTFVASIYAAGLDKTLAKAPAIAYLVPSNDAFASLGLVMSYLLLPVARPELRSLLRYHAIDELVYLDDFPVGGSVRYPTLLDGAEIFVERSSYNSSLTVHGPTVGGLPANGETRDGVVVEGNVLTSTGVMHLVDQVELPPDLDIGIVKLLKGARASTMADLIRVANMSWVLEGKLPPSPDGGEFDIAGLGKGRNRRKKGKGTERISSSRQAFTILCPTDKALARLNLTYYLSNPTALSSLIRQHIIPTDAFLSLPSDGKPLSLADEATFPTLLDQSQVGGESKYGQVAFRKWGDDGWVVGIKGARGTEGATDSARVVAFGKASPWFFADGDSTRLAGGGGVFTIDSVLIPYRPNWFRRWGWIVVLVVLGVMLLACIALLVVKMWRGKKEQYERLEGEED